MDLAQELATAYANDDWDRVRELNLTRRGLTNAQLFDKYGDLDASTVVLNSYSSVPGSAPDTAFALHVGLVAHQTHGGQQTTLYCVTWTVHLDSQTVDEAGGPAMGPYSGWLDPVAEIDTIRNGC